MCGDDEDPAACLVHGAIGPLNRIALTLLSGPTTTSCAIARGSMRAPDASARATCTDASYFAPIGQIGTHDALPQHGGRSA